MLCLSDRAGYSAGRLVGWGERGLARVSARRRRESTRWGTPPAEGWGMLAADDNAAEGTSRLSEAESGGVLVKPRDRRHDLKTGPVVAGGMGRSLRSKEVAGQRLVCVQRAWDQAQGGVCVGLRAARVEAVSLGDVENGAPSVTAGGGVVDEPLYGSFSVENP